MKIKIVFLTDNFLFGGEQHTYPASDHNDPKTASLEQ